LSWKLDE
jgi:hypothetical protein